MKRIGTMNIKEILQHRHGLGLRLRGLAFDVVLTVDRWSDIANHVVAGVGLSVVAELCLRERTALRRIAIADAKPPRRDGVMTRRDGIVSPAARRFLSVMAPDGREAPGG